MIALGSKVKDVVSGFTGIVIGRYHYLYGCTRYGVQPRTEKGKPNSLPNTKTFDEPQLKVVSGPSKTVIETINDKIDTGGPAPHHPDEKYL